MIFFGLSCSKSKREAEHISEPKGGLKSRLNLESINTDSSVFERMQDDVGNGEEYVEFSYNFEQTSLFKRHLNTIGLLIDPNNSEYIRRFSYSYKKAGEHEKAMKMLNLALETDTNPSAHLKNLDYAAWNYLYFYRDYDHTIKTVDKILELTQNELEVSCHGEPCLLLKGQALYRLKKYKQAIDVFESYQKNEIEQGFNPMDNFYVVFYKAICLTELNQLDAAISNFSDLIKEHPSAEVSYQLALLYYRKSDFESSKTQLLEAEKALEEGFTFKEPYFERFDKVFNHQIEDMRRKIDSKKYFEH
jgi:tetratricopeptide (TPR) repeat protein